MPDAVHPDDPNLIYLALEHGGILRSLDRGETGDRVVWAAPC